MKMLTQVGLDSLAENHKEKIFITLQPSQFTNQQFTGLQGGGRGIRVTVQNLGIQAKISG